MIEINLLPGGGKKARKGGGPKLNLGASLASIRDKVREPWHIGAVVSVALVVVVVGGMYTTQQARESTIDDALEKAFERHGADAKIVVLPYARYQLPRNAVRMDHADERVFAHASKA